MNLILQLSVSVFLLFTACGSEAMENGGFRISSFLGTGADANMVFIEAGSEDGISTGDVFRVYRPTQNTSRDVGVSIETGEAKAVMVYPHKSIAQVTIQSTPLSQEVFPKFSQVMAGDIVVRQRIAIKPSMAISPEMELPYSKIFDDPNPVPQNFELSAMGRELIQIKSSDLAKLKAGLLMVIGHTDAKGSSEANQIESYQRAVVVRQYLVDQLGFDPERIVAIGKGEDELPEVDLTPGFAERARRVVLKVVASN